MTVRLSEITRFEMAVGAKIISLLGQPTDSNTLISTGDIDYVLAYPYEAKLSQHIYSERPTITFHQIRFPSTLADPSTYSGLPVECVWDLHIQQKLINQESAGYVTNTHQRIWDIASYLAARIDNTKLLPESELRTTRVMAMEPDVQEVQVNQGVFGVVVTFQSFLSLSKTREINSDVIFSEHFEDRVLGPVRRIEAAITDGDTTLDTVEVP